MLKHKVRLRIVVLVPLLLVLSAFGQSNVPQPPKPRVSDEEFLGVIEKGTYRNSYFGFELKFSDSWNVVDQETSRAAMQIGTDSLKGKSERANKELEASVAREVVLLHVTKKPVGAIANSNFAIAVFKQPSAAVLPSMVAEATKSVLTASPNVKVTKDTRSQQIGGKSFSLVDYEMTFGDQKVKAKTFVTVIKGFSISMSLSYLDDSDLPDLQAIVDSISFARK